MGSAAAPQPSKHLLYQREVLLPQQASGQVCFVLDATVFAHTETPGAGDVRIFGQEQEREFEVPFALIESGPATLEPESATAGNVTSRGGVLSFDLSMPPGDYTAVALNLNAKNFLGAAEVKGIDAHGRSVRLGTYAVFDLSAQGLARSTLLSLPHSSFPVLHIDLRLFDLEGNPTSPAPSILAGATLPPSRQAQTLYTSVASSSAVQQQGHWSTATLFVPAHVPIERARFVLRPPLPQSFLRNATIAATPLEKGWKATGAAEGVSGNIFRVTRSASDGVPAIDSEVLTINTVIGANLESAAKIVAAIDNGSSPPLPIDRVELQMRQRSLCFEARPGTRYTLRYGDAELSGPSYSYARRFALAARPLPATLGPERRNTAYTRPGTGEQQQNRGRELPWILLIAGIVVAGVIGLQYVRYKREETL